jgi:DNA-binding transcriptional ArsR family regulator
MDTLARLLSSRVKAEVFRLLFGSGTPELHVRELARRAGLNEATVRQELIRLTGLGLLDLRRDGNRAYYRAHTAHPLYPEIRNLVLKTSGLVDVLHEALASLNIQVAFVFGSVADGTQKPESDLDLMVIGDVTLRGVVKLLSGTATRLGREVNPYALTPGEFAKKKRARDHFLTEVLTTKRLFVIGDEDDLRAMGR